jgi:ribose transport system ATP-binding protein
MGSPVTALHLEHVSKRFGAVQALDDVTLDVAAGEIHALVGTNGSGKSTLVKILAGYHAPEPGARIRLWEKDMRFPLTGSERHGLAVIHQDLALVDEMTVLENAGVSIGYGSQNVLPVNWAQERRRCAALLAEFGVTASPNARVARLTPAERTTVGIVRALLQLRAEHRRHIFLLDEPTVSFARPDVERLFATMRRAADAGGSVIFISHRLREVLEISDRVSVLRDGRLVATTDTKDVDARQLLQLMLGRDIGSFYPPKTDVDPGAPVLRVNQLSGNIARNVSFDVRRGEVLGVTGLAGMGQDEIPYLIVGARKPKSGSISLEGGKEKLLNPGEAIRRGVILLPANRQRDAVWLDATAVENVTLPRLATYFHNGWLDLAGERNAVARLLQRFQVRPSNPAQPIRRFSGGNQQKAVLARALEGNPTVLLLHEPTTGVDAGARKEILNIVQQTAASGTGIVVFSSEYEELAHMCHRVLILDGGEIVREVVGESVTERQILEACHAA